MDCSSHPGTFLHSAPLEGGHHAVLDAVGEDVGAGACSPKTSDLVGLDNMALVLLHQVVARCLRLDHWQRAAPSFHVLVGRVGQQNTFDRMIAGLQVRSQADLQVQLTST